MDSSCCFTFNYIICQTHILLRRWLKLEYHLKLSLTSFSAEIYFQQILHGKSHANKKCISINVESSLNPDINEAYLLTLLKEEKIVTFPLVQNVAYVAETISENFNNHAMLFRLMY